MQTIDQQATRLFGGKKLELLCMWVIYDHPTDIPDRFVARRHYVGLGMSLATEDLLTGLTLDELRRILPGGLTRVARHPTDDPKIVETWL